MRSSPFVLVYIQRELRLHDHPALYAASKTNLPVLPLFVFDPKTLLGPAEKWWLTKTLQSLPFSVEEGNPQTILQKWIKKKPAAIFCSTGTTPNERQSNLWLKKQAEQSNIDFHCYHGNLLLNPTSITTQKGTPIKTFSQFAKTAMKENLFYQTVGKPTLKLYQSAVKRPKLKASQELSHYEKYWSPGEANARSEWATFRKNHLYEYDKARDIPSMEGTSYLSPSLHFGEISIREVMANFKGSQSASEKKFLSELLWREYAHYLLYHFPDLTHKPFDPRFNSLTWKTSTKAFNAWKNGLTGVPIVDAGMRCLLKTGWMHNRVRMIVASYLTKDLLIDWKKGAEWFEERLVDADLANNRMNWQWVSGCGIDAAPYFRIFNPYLQSEKFDPDGTYIRTWIPELANFSKKEIHRPHLYNASIKGYPKEPLVDHDIARKEALKRFKQAR